VENALWRQRRNPLRIEEYMFRRDRQDTPAVITSVTLAVLLYVAFSLFRFFLHKTSIAQLLQDSFIFFFTYIPYILILSKIYLPNDVQLNCLKNYFKIYIKTAPTCFGVITIIRERTVRSC
jgi:hypothetical protein